MNSEQPTTIHIYQKAKKDLTSELIIIYTKFSALFCSKYEAVAHRYCDKCQQIKNVLMNSLKASLEFYSPVPELTRQVKKKKLNSF